VGVDPTIEALREVLHESLDEIRLGIADLTVDELNAAPAGGETNPAAVIVTHALGATLSWLSLAMGAPLPDRDREAEFRTVADEAFASRTEAMIARCLAVLDGAEWDPARVGTPNWNPRLSEEPRTAAYAAAHALAHLGEHVGHLHMTRELLRPTG
jgi:DinB superfamily